MSPYSHNASCNNAREPLYFLLESLLNCLIVHYRLLQLTYVALPVIIIGTGRPKCLRNAQAVTLCRVVSPFPPGIRAARGRGRLQVPHLGIAPIELISKDILDPAPQQD